MGSLNSENIQQFCRACLRHLFKKQHQQQPTMQQNEPTFYHIERTKDLNKWMAILNPLEDTTHTNNNQENQQDMFAKYVCRSCYENFKHVNDFREMVLHSYRVMTKLLATAEKKECPKPKEEIVTEELQIKSEQIDSDDDYMVNDDWEIDNYEESNRKNKKYSNPLQLPQEDYDEEEEDDDDDDAICRELELPSTTNLSMLKDNMKMEATGSNFVEPTVDMLLSPLSEGADGQPKAIKSYKCPICKNSYIHKYTYIAHIRQMHLGIERAFECEICHKKYTKFCNLYRHLRLDHNESLRQYKCGYRNCNRSFRQLSTRRKHYENMHNHETLPAQQKEKLSNDFLRRKESQFAKRSINDNIATTSNSSTNSDIEKPLKFSTKKRHCICPLCSLTFETSYNLKVHMNESHIDDLKFPCRICGKHKISQMKLDEHIATAHNNFRVKCDICQKALKSKSHLRQHILSIHKGIKPYACAYCPSTFAAKNTLNVHTRIHTGEKPFKCPVCDRRFRQLTPMKKHVEIHERERRNATTEMSAC